MTLAEIVELARRLYPEGSYPKPLDVLIALHAVRSKQLDLQAVPSHLRKRVQPLMRTRNPVSIAFGVDLSAIAAKVQPRVRKGELMLGHLVLGGLAEQAFESIYRRRLSGSEFSLEDYRESRNDTDYRVLNGGGRPLFRINIKFHGTQFRQAEEKVGLQPADCFPLATYKIWSATNKERDENLPYLFLVISTPIAADHVLQQIPSNERELVRLAHASDSFAGKRSLEERIVASLTAGSSAFVDVTKAWIEQLAAAQWRVISAQRAYTLLHSRLFDRVFAVRTRNFNQAFKNAEIDMHLSLREDMTSLEEMLDMLAREGSQAVVGRATRGLI